MRSRHPAIGATITLKEYLAASHAVVRPEGRVHVFDQFLQERGFKRRIALEISHFMSLLPIIATSDLIATVPRDMADFRQTGSGQSSAAGHGSVPRLAGCA